ncbi:hypothetical protein Aperf_G00000091350 [Anoplocephala perfoliata]
MTSQACSVSGSNHDEDEDVHPLSEIMCNCELCYARLCTATRHLTEDDSMYNPDLFDYFPYPTNPKLLPNYCLHGYNMPFSYAYGDSAALPTNKLRFLGGLRPDSLYPMFPSPEWFYSSKIAAHLPHDYNIPALSTSLQLYLSKESVIHLRLSAYVVLERSGTAFRLINYRNNSAIALSENGQYGYVYHINCRGLINIHHEKLSFTFDRDRQALLRTEKPSFVKKENEYYRLTKHHWTQCRPISIDYFDRDRTPEILKKSRSEKPNEESKLLDLVNSSIIQKVAGGLTSDARIEQRVNGDVTLSWVHGEQLNSLVVSPLTGGLSLSTKNLEIIATPKNEVYIVFADFFAHVGPHQMTVSSGAITNLANGAKGHPCILKLVNNRTDSQNLPQYCPYMNHPQSSSNRHNRRENSAANGGSIQNTQRSETPTVARCDTAEREELARKSCLGSNCDNGSYSSDTSSPAKTTKNLRGDKKARLSQELTLSTDT